MLKAPRSVLFLLLASTLVMNAACASTIKKMAVDSMVERVRREKPLTQGDLNTVMDMLRGGSVAGNFTESRKIYVVGKVATALAREYSQPLAMAGFRVDTENLTANDVLSLLDVAGLIKKSEYDYLRDVDLKIFNPLDQETQLISQNKTSLILAVAQLALREGWLNK